MFTVCFTISLGYKQLKSLHVHCDTFVTSFSVHKGHCTDLALTLQFMQCFIGLMLIELMLFFSHLSQTQYVL